MSGFFQEFKDDALRELAAKNIPHSSVDFVNVGGSKWMSIEDFEVTTACDPCNKIENNDSGNWSHVPRTFAIVLLDGRWLHYASCRDHTYSKWVLSSIPKRSPKRMLPLLPYTRSQTKMEHPI